MRKTSDVSYNCRVFKQNNSQSELFNSNDMILLQVDFRNSDVYFENLCVVLKFTNSFETARIKLAQIIDLDMSNLTYQSLYNQYRTLASNVFLCACTTNGTLNKTITFNISNYNCDAIMSSDNILNIVIYLESCSEPCEMNVSNVLLSYADNKSCYLPIDDNNMFKLDMLNGVTFFNDTIYTYHNELIDFPITFGQMNSESPYWNSNSYLYHFSLNTEAYINDVYTKISYIENNEIKEAYILDCVNFFNNSGDYEKYYLLKNLDDDTKNKINPIIQSQNNEIRKYLYEWNEKTYANNPSIFYANKGEIDSLEIESTFFTAKKYETSNYMQDYAITINNDTLNLLTIYDATGKIFIYTKYKNYSPDETFLHLSKIIYPNDQSVFFENEAHVIDQDEDYYNYKTNNIFISNSNDSIKLTYQISSNTLEKYLIKEVDFINQYRRIEFNTFSPFNDINRDRLDGVEYKVIDYQNSNDLKVLKHIKVILSSDYVIQVEDVLADVLYFVDCDLTEKDSIKINKYYGILGLNDGKVSLSSVEYMRNNNKIILENKNNSDKTILENKNNSDKTIYLLDDYKNIKEIIHQNKERISYTYNEYDFPVKVTTSKYINKELQNNNFRERFKHWETTNTTFVLKENNVSSTYIKVKAYSSLAQTLNLDVDKRYELSGHIKPSSLNVYGALNVVGGYNILNGDVLEWHDVNIRHEIDITKNDWYYFNTDGFYIPSNARDIEIYLVVETGQDLFIDYLTLNDDNGNNYVNNYNFDNLLENWDYSITPDIYENPDTGYYVRVDEGGTLSQSLKLISGNTYILRGLIKRQAPSIESTSSIKLDVSYYTDVEHREECVVVLNHNVNGWYEFMSEQLVIPTNATQVECELKLSSTEVIYVKELNISHDNIKYSNLIENGIFQNGQSDISTDPIYSNTKFIVSDSNIIVEPSVETIDKCNIYGNNVLKLYGEKHNSYSTRTIYKQINISGQKGDLLSANVLVKYNESVKENLCFFVKVYDNENNYEEHIVYPTPNFGYYQLLTNHIIVKKNYNKIILGIRYKGLNDTFVTGFEFYKNYNISNYSYDELLNVVKKDEYIIIYDDNQRVKKIIDPKGQANIFEYYEGHLVKHYDSYGNIFSSQYQNNRKIIDKYELVNEEVFYKGYEYDDNLETNDKLMVTHTDYYSNDTSYLYDYLYRNKKIKYPNEHIITNTYNNMDQLTKVESSKGTTYRNVIDYDDDNNKIKSIIPGNETTINDYKAYQYIYDDLNRISEIKLYDNILYKYVYNDEGLVETVQMYDSIYKYKYDERRRIIEVRYSKNISQPYYSLYKKIIYDKFNNIMYVKDCVKNIEIHYQYDIQNRLNKTSKLYTNDIIEYTYDEYNNITSKSFNKQVSFDKINYFNKIDNIETKDKKSLSELINEYNVEIINASLFDEGLFGISRNKNNSLDIAYDANINKKIISFKQDNRYTSYSLKTWNNDRLIDVDNGLSKKLKYLKSDFDYNKTFAFWVRPIDSFSLTTLMNIEVVNYQGDQTDDDVRLLINDNGNVLFRNNDITHLISDNSLLLNKWNFVSISFIKDQAEDIVTYKLCVNNSIKSVIAPLTFSIINMKTMSIGKEKTNTDRIMCFDIALITIDSHIHDTLSINKLRDYTEEFVYSKNETQVGLNIILNSKTHKYVSEYDINGRMLHTKFYLNEAEKYAKSYTYNKTQITNENIGKMSYSYTYDNMGNIATRTIKDEELGKIYDINTYSYDELGRLTKQVRELYNFTDSPTFTTITYDYDENGNIKNRKNYNSLALTNNNLELEYQYSYDNTYKDKLISVNEIQNSTNNNSFKTIEYSNNSLYPSKINGVSLTWNKGKLTSYGNNTYEYNLLGQRTKKTTQTHIHEYTYDDNLLIKEKIKNKSNNQVVVLEYIYDQQNILIGVVENNNVYYYDRDITGEIRGLIDTNGNYVIKYYYTAFGEVTKEPISENNITNFISVNNIINFNPFLYKGYYYDDCDDDKMGLFWLSSRYYSPELGRFIQPADVSSLNPHSINGLNLYAYANYNRIGRAKSPSIANVGVISSLGTNTLLSTLKLPVVNSNASNSNYWDPHVKVKWLDTGWPTLFSLSKDGFEAINWSLSIYKDSLFFDNQENHFLYFSLGNISIFAGLVFPKDSSKDKKTRFGFDASANVIEIGYDGRIIDASVSGLTIGATYLLKDGIFKLEYGYGWWGWSVSIDFIELFKWLFGGE